MKTFRETEITRPWPRRPDSWAASRSGSRIVSGARSTRSIAATAAARSKGSVSTALRIRSRSSARVGSLTSGQASTGLYGPTN